MASPLLAPPIEPEVWNTTSIPAIVLPPLPMLVPVTNPPVAIPEGLSILSVVPFASVCAFNAFSEAVSYTHLTLPTTPYV